jgi:DNA-directed RNA polymerase
MKYSGGYLTIDTDLIGTGHHKHTAGLPTAIPSDVLRALNTVQETPWRINKFTLGVIQHFWNENIEIDAVPSRVDLELPPRVDDAVWQEMTRVERGDVKERRRFVYTENTRLKSLRDALRRKLSLAERFADTPAVYFPHRLDFRGRVYPVTQDLNPQADDMGKALLEFANGKPLGKVGSYWLSIHLANAFGMDKLPMAERLAWVEANAQQIVGAAEHPTEGSDLNDGKPWWCLADSPWQFLAACRAWAGYLAEGPDYVCHTPVHVDGSCNGLQHLSAMGRDPVGAAATNLRNLAERQDIYQIVADKLSAAVEFDAKQGHKIASRWWGNVNRAVVKRAVMTVPYGVTDMGIRDQLVRDRWCQGMDGRPSDNAGYLRDQLKEAISDTVVAARSTMDWFQAVALKRAEENLPLDWSSPSGLMVRQAYYRLRLKRVITMVGKVQYRPRTYIEQMDGDLEKRKQVLAASPNIIHSFDAAHMVMTVNHAKEVHGLSDFVVVHDSFGTHAADMSALGVALRSTFVDIYRENWFERLTEEFVSDYPGILPDPPPMGDFDIEEVKDATYFFA